MPFSDAPKWNSALRMSPAREVVADLIGKFPDAGAMTLAKMAYKAHPKLWSTLDSCRSMIRKQFGVFGNEMRHLASHKRAARNAGDAFARLPEGQTQLKEWRAFEVAGPCKALIISDLHIPYHDRDALLTALEFGKEHGANTIILNGDVADFFALSFWEKNPEQRDFPGELQTVKTFLGMLRDCNRKARIIYKLGNHEERFERYMRVKAPELLGVPEFSFAGMMGLGELGIELVGDKRPIKLGDLNVIHGHEYRFSISNPVNPARGLFLRAKAYGLCGHFHQSSYHTEKTVEQSVIATWSTGCLCDLHPEYLPLNNWCHGFAFVEVEKGGKFNVRNKVVRDGKIY